MLNESLNGESLEEILGFDPGSLTGEELVEKSSALWSLEINDKGIYYLDYGHQGRYFIPDSHTDTTHQNFKDLTI